MAKTEPTRFPFSRRLAELEQIVAELESPEADLEQGIERYETGIKLVAELGQYLKTAANRVETIKQSHAEPPDAMPAESDDVVTDELPF